MLIEISSADVQLMRPARVFESLSFRPLSKRDLPLLHEWVQRAHVAEWWRAPRTLNEIEADYVPVIEGFAYTRAYIVHAGSQPVGFIQDYDVMGAGDGWWESETDPGVRGIDQFLAHTESLGKGLGTAMVKAFVTKLFEDPTVTKVQTDPAPTNHRAIRCYEKAGFRKARLVETPDGPALLMLCSSPPVR